MNTELSFGQRLDHENGLIECWFVHGALDEIKTWDLSQKDILMFGGGFGDVWLAKRCKTLVVIERNEGWLNVLKQRREENNCRNIYYVYRPCNEGSGMAESYMQRDEFFQPDIIINDDAYRTEVCEMAVNYFKEKKGGGILISDNWKQSYVWISPKAEEIMQPFEAHIHEQSDHLDNDGVNKWKTAIHFIK